MNIVARYECVYNRDSKNFKDKHKKSNSWEKIGEKFKLSCLFLNIFRTNVSFGFEADVVIALGLKEEINLLAAKFLPRCPPCCLLCFSREHNARVHLTLPLNEMYGYSRLCDSLCGRRNRGRGRGRGARKPRKNEGDWGIPLIFLASLAPLPLPRLRRPRRLALRSFAIIWKPALRLHPKVRLRQSRFSIAWLV